MFHPRSSEFDPRVSSIVDHLRAIEKELGAIGKIAGQRASSGASTTANQFVDAITPILNDLTDRFRRGRRATLDEAASFGTEAVRVSARAGNDALDRLGDQAKQRPLLTAAVALGIGILVGFAARSD
jgi:hypothetical protein